MKRKKKRKIYDPVGQLCSGCSKLKHYKCPLYRFEVTGHVTRRTFFHWLVKQFGGIKYQCKAAPLIERDMLGGKPNHG